MKGTRKLTDDLVGLACEMRRHRYTVEQIREHLNRCFSVKVPVRTLNWHFAKAGLTKKRAK